MDVGLHGLESTLVHCHERGCVFQVKKKKMCLRVCLQCSYKATLQGFCNPTERGSACVMEAFCIINFTSLEGDYDCAMQ